MAVDFAFRKKAVASLTSKIGVYILADLDNVPIYVGKSVQGIRARVARHLTSARSDIIANRQIDVWEIAYVWEFPTEDKQNMNNLEALLFYHYNPKSLLMNGTRPPLPTSTAAIPKPTKIVAVMSETEIAERKKPEQRLPRQAEMYAQIIGHFLTVKNSNQIARAIAAHFGRLSKYHKLLLRLPAEDEKDIDE
jgi:hypothetical protein